MNRRVSMETRKRWKEFCISHHLACDCITYDVLEALYEIRDFINYLPVAFDQKRQTFDLIEKIMKRLGEDGTYEEPPYGWRPIDSAPKDGTTVLLCTEGDPESYVGFWSDGSQTHPGRGGEGWFYGDDRANLLTARNCYPTHWMPLPPPRRKA